MAVSDSRRDYYCSMKFRYLKIDLESKTTYTCHAAKPHAVDFEWLSNNTGQLFNTPINITERTMMLANQRNNSCEQNCWSAEDVAAVSPRMSQGGPAKTHFDIVAQPEIIDLTVGSDCNLTCSYCCKEFSSAWRKDLMDNGKYNIVDSNNRFELTAKDRVLTKISQAELKSTQHYQTLLNEIKLSVSTLKKLTVTGGEPFLDNQLMGILSELLLNHNTVVEIYTGLGVNATRFEKILHKLKLIKNLDLIISAECINELYEFNRYGNTWQEFENRIQLLEKHGIKYRFHSTISNLTIFGFAEFFNYFKHSNHTVTFAYQPVMMSPYVLDPKSKEIITQQLLSLPENIQRPIRQSMTETPTETQRQNIKTFLKEFVTRRKNLDVNIYPTHFLDWMNYVV
jgi:organic radical activating enzyme